MSNALIADHGVPHGRLVQSVTQVVLVNNTAKTLDLTVPTGKRWKVILMKMTNGDNVNRNLQMNLYLEAAKTHFMARIVWDAAVASGNHTHWPKNIAEDDKVNAYFDLIMDAGNTLSFVWEAGGASAGATDDDGLIVNYLEADM